MSLMSPTDTLATDAILQHVNTMMREIIAEMDRSREDTISLIRAETRRHVEQALEEYKKENQEDDRVAKSLREESEKLLLQQQLQQVQQQQQDAANALNATVEEACRRVCAMEEVIGQFDDALQAAEMRISNIEGTFQSLQKSPQFTPQFTPNHQQHSSSFRQMWEQQSRRHDSGPMTSKNEKEDVQNIEQGTTGTQAGSSVMLALRRLQSESDLHSDELSNVKASIRRLESDVINMQQRHDETTVAINSHRSAAETQQQRLEHQMHTLRDTISQKIEVELQRALSKQQDEINRFHYHVEEARRAMEAHSERAIAGLRMECWPAMDRIRQETEEALVKTKEGLLERANTIEVSLRDDAHWLRSNLEEAVRAVESNVELQNRTVSSELAFLKSGSEALRVQVQRAATTVHENQQSVERFLQTWGGKNSNSSSSSAVDHEELRLLVSRLETHIHEIHTDLKLKEVQLSELRKTVMSTPSLSSSPVARGMRVGPNVSSSSASTTFLGSGLLGAGVSSSRLSKISVQSSVHSPCTTTD
eukprot:PhM_4_TR4601/c0_g2_i1/m.39154